MALSTERSDDDEQYVLVAKIDNAKNIYPLLKAIHFKESAVCYGSDNGLKVTVEDAKCVQANAFIQADLFQEFIIREESVTFKVNLSVLLDCLTIFGSGTTPGVTTALKMCYAGYGSPLMLLLEEGGVLTDCSLKTQEPEETLDFNFSNASVINKVILRSECLREIFCELDISSETIEILMSPDQPYFRITTFGTAGLNQVDIPKDSDMMESFQCMSTVSSRYKLSLLKPSVRPLSSSQKVSIRTDDRGFLCLQYMIKTEDSHVCFVEFYCAPELEEDENDR